MPAVVLDIVSLLSRACFSSNEFVIEPNGVSTQVGTCFDYSAGVDAVEAKFGPQLKRAGVTPKAFLWGIIQAGERDYAYLSSLGEYKTFNEIFKSTFRRHFYMTGFENDDFCSDEDIDGCLTAINNLVPRPGLAEMFADLRAAGVDIYCATDCDAESVTAYFAKAGILMPASNVMSADHVSAAKPQPALYHHALHKIGLPKEEVVFAAAHAWDTLAARKAGFSKTAYCTIYEKYPCEDIFGSNDRVAHDLKSFGQAIIELACQKV